MPVKPLESTARPVTVKEVAVSAPQGDVVVDVVATTEQARADLHIQTVCLLILAFLAAGVGLFLLRPVLVPFVLALFFAACLKPGIEVQRKHPRAPPPVAVARAVPM